MDGADTPSHVNSGDGMSPFEALPEELLLHIFTYSTSDALRALGLVSQACRLRLLANDALLWRPRVLDLMTCSSASLTSDVIATTIEREAETLKASLAKMAGEDGSGYLSWRRFYAGVERLAANWAAMAYARRHWYHNTDYALTLRYTVEELTSWVYAGDEEEDGEDPEGWDKCSVDVLDVDIGGGRLLTAGDDGSVRAWDVHGRLQRVYADEWNVNGIACVRHDDDVVVGSYCALCVSGMGTVVVWDTSSGEVRHTLNPDNAAVDMALRNPSLIACCGSDVVNWDLNEAVPVHVFQHSYPVSQVELHPIDPNVLLTGSIFDSKIKLWDLRTPGKCVSKAHLNENLSRRFAYDGDTLVAGEVADGGAGGAVAEWDMRSLGKPRMRLFARPPATGVDVLAVDFSSKAIISAHESLLVCVWSRTDGSAISHLDQVPSPLVAVDREMERCFVGDENGGIYFIDLAQEVSVGSEGDSHRKVEHAREVERPLPASALSFAAVDALCLTKRGLAATFSDGSIRFYDFLGSPSCSSPVTL